MATLEEIARAAGVSRSTVSRVINNEPRVSEETRLRVWQTVREQGFQPNTAARALAGRRSHIIGLAVQRPFNTVSSDPFFAALVQVITQACEERDYYLMLSLTSSQQPTSYTKMIRGGHLDGLLIFYSCVDDSLVRALEAEGLPFVLMGRHLTRDDVPSVDMDNVQGAHLAVLHLAQLGRRRIATVTGPLFTVSALDRRSGFLEEVASLGLECPPEYVVEGDYSEVGGYWAMANLLHTRPAPDAAFVANDAMAAGAIRAIREAGLRVPDDIAIVGFDDTPYASMVQPALTTIRQSADQMGRTTVAMLLDIVAHRNGSAMKDLSRKIVLPVELVIRESCGAATATKMTVAGAVREMAPAGVA